MGSPKKRENEIGNKSPCIPVQMAENAKVTLIALKVVRRSGDMANDLLTRMLEKMRPGKGKQYCRVGLYVVRGGFDSRA